MTTGELRHRSAGNPSVDTMNSEKKKFIHELGAGLSAKSMIDSSPQQHGLVLKLHVPIFYSILPEFLQKIILSISFLKFLAPSWKQRYLIVCGSYLYKFKDQTSSVPKGAPFPLETVNISLNTEHIPELGSLPPGFTSVVRIATLRRQHYYALADDEEARLWIRTIDASSQETITRSMGHSKDMPYPQKWSYFDSLGRSLIKSKERIRTRINEHNMREMEMSTFSEAGSMPREFHG